MARRSEFVEYLVEQLASLGEVTAKSMFGGWGILIDGRMFGLVSDDTFYIKADAENRADFERENLTPFRYRRREREVAVMTYFQPPAAAIEDRELLCEWARKGVEAAARSAAKRTRRKK